MCPAIIETLLYVQLTQIFDLNMYVDGWNEDFSEPSMIILHCFDFKM